MTISTHQDLSDVFNPVIVKPIIEQVFTELQTNSIFTRILAEMLPKGADASRFGRVSKSCHHHNTWTKLINSLDGLYRVGRVLPTDDDITIRLNLYRKAGYNGSQSGHVFEREFYLRLEFTDNALKRQFKIKSDLSVLSFVTNSFRYDTSKDFEGFVLGTVMNDFNAHSFIITEFEEHKQKYRDIHAATSRYP